MTTVTTVTQVPEINRIWVILGDACNMSCKYCAERNNLERHISQPEVTDDFINWLNGLIKSSKIPPTINFYGGEPTLYFDTIKEIMKKIKGKARFTTMTNGKALTHEMVDYFNEQKITVNFSWDGLNVAQTRGEDVFELNKSVLLIDSLWINATLTSANYPLSIARGINKFYDEYMKYHEKPFRVNIGLATDVCGDSSLYVYDYDRIYREMTQICIEGCKCENVGSQIIYDYLLQQFFRGLMGLKPQYNCIDIDTKGNFFMCPFRRAVVGNVTDFDAYLEKTKKFKAARQNPDCKNCPINPVCDHGCRFNFGNPEKMEASCALRQAFYLPIFKISTGQRDEDEKEGSGK